MCGKSFQIYGAHIPRKCIDSRHRGIFTNAPPHSKSHPPPPPPPGLSSCLHALGRRKLLIPPGSILSKICFPQQQKGLEKTMICFIKIQSENMKMIWNIRVFIFFMIYIFFKCDGLTVL